MKSSKTLRAMENEYRALSRLCARCEHHQNSALQRAHVLLESPRASEPKVRVKWLRHLDLFVYWKERRRRIERAMSRLHGRICYEQYKLGHPGIYASVVVRNSPAELAKLREAMSSGQLWVSVGGPAVPVLR